MSHLPHHRRIQSGRTHSSVYRPETFVAIERTRPSRIADVVLAVVLGILGAALAVYWLSA